MPIFCTGFYHSQHVTGLSMAGTQAEQRDIHSAERKETSDKINDLAEPVTHSRDILLTNQIVNTSAHIEFPQKAFSH